MGGGLLHQELNICSLHQYRPEGPNTSNKTAHRRALILSNRFHKLKVEKSVKFLTLLEVEDAKVAGVVVANIVVVALFSVIAALTCISRQI